MKVVNDGVEIGEEPVVNSRYSIVIAAAKRARQIIAGAVSYTHLRSDAGIHGRRGGTDL